MFTPHQFFALVLRLFAVWLLLAAGQIVLVSYAVHRGAQDNVLISYAVAAMYAVVALLLWLFPLAVAGKILPKTTGNDAGRAVSCDSAAIAFIVAGLAIIALKALTPLANYVSLLTMLVLSGQTARMATASLHIDGVIAIVMLLIGLSLVLKARPLARIVLR
ncbi:hypothetical protein GJ699_25090 [Duganella sp. FT80W]|uniref:Uncharacterized protein n=1 Tax=Duganella guangzhouensis TaxID=2666084 RepID=A0A6I2L548_9BURK|nr:hypothetical protein [Duganella guangzhouensis]MRW93268.1 hypothetical protein [Duganella guangzhouensis]